MNPAQEAAERPPESDPAAVRIRRVLTVCGETSNLRRTLLIALVVGCVLTVVNQLDVFVDGKETALTAMKVVLNFCVPFVVSNLGVLAGSRTARE